MKCNKLLAGAAFALLFPASTIKATDLYVYHSGNYTPVGTMLNAHKITFSNDSIFILSEKHVTQKASFANFDYLRFYKTPIPTAIQNINGETASILFNGEQISIQSPLLIKRVELISASATLLQRLTPRSNSLTYSVSELSAGVYLIKVITADGVIVKKIIKN